MRIPHPDEGVPGDHHQRKSAGQSLRGLHYRVNQGFITEPGEEIHNNLRVRGGLKDRPLGHQLPAEFSGVHQAPVVRNGEIPPGTPAKEWLGIAFVMGAGRGIPDMANANPPL